MRVRQVARGTSSGVYAPGPWPERALSSLAAWTLLPLLGLLPPNELDAQQPEAPSQLVGRVIDAASGEPIEAALVVLEAAPGEASPRPAGDPPRSLTAPDGRFELSGVAAGMTILRVEHVAYGVHRHPLRVEGAGSGFVEVALSASAISIEPLLVEVDRPTELGGRGSPSTRNVIMREVIADAAASGVSVGEFLDREVSGLFVRSNPQIGGAVCLEFRGARRGTGPCRPPQVYIDGITVPDPLDFFGHVSLDGLERIQVISPSEAGARFGPNAGWGVLLLETRRTGRDPAAEVLVVQRTSQAGGLVDWTFEGRVYPWARVYTAAFVGNAVGLMGGAAVLSRCMDLGARRFYRGSDACGVGLLLTSGVVAAALPALAGSFGARLAGATSQSRGHLGRSILYSLPVYVPGFAIASIHGGTGGLGGAGLIGLAVVAVGAPLLNTLADRKFRERR